MTKNEWMQIISALQMKQFREVVLRKLYEGQQYGQAVMEAIEEVFERRGK